MMAPAVAKKKTPTKSSSAKSTGQRDATLHVDRIAVPSTSPAAQAREAVARDFAIEAARSLKDDKCSDVVVLDLRGHSQVTDFFVVATGTSDRQMRSAGDHVSDLGEKRGIKLHRHNLRESQAKWVVLDFVDIIVHVFEAETRRYYDIETLWTDATPVEWRRPGERDDTAETPAGPKPSRNRANLRSDDVLG